MIKVSEILVLSLAICSVKCLSVQPQIIADDGNIGRGPIDDSLYNLVDNLRYSLRCGLPGMPSLAPFVISSAEIDERGFLYDVQGNLRNLTLEGLDGYEINTATLNILTLRTSVHLTFPNVALSTFYDLDALLLRFLPIYGHGRMYLGVNDFKVQANGRISLSLLTGRLNLTTLDIGISMGSIYSDTTGIYDSRIVSTLFNVALERTLREVFENNKAKIEAALVDLLLPILNQYLNELTLQDLLNGNVSEGGPHIDDETGELICETNEEASTTADEQTSQGEDSRENEASEDPTSENSTNDDSTLPNKATDEGIESDDFNGIHNRLLKNSLKIQEKGLK